MVPQCACFADIGCDHGKLCDLVLSTGRAKRAIATDLSNKSLLKARSKLGECPNVNFRCGNGLSVLGPNEADVICMAGMGARTIQEILETGSNVARCAQYLILSPHRHAERLRSFLGNASYAICAERIVRERNHFYPVMLVQPADHSTIADAFHEMVGWADPRDPVVREYLNEMLRKSYWILNKLEETQRDSARAASARMFVLRLETFLRASGPYTEIGKVNAVTADIT